MITSELIGYIRQQKSLGISEDVLIKNLSRGGWNEADIKEALGTINKTTQVFAAGTKVLPLWVEIGLASFWAFLIIIFIRFCIYVLFFALASGSSAPITYGPILVIFAPIINYPIPLLLIIGAVCWCFTSFVLKKRVRKFYDSTLAVLGLLFFIAYVFLNVFNNGVSAGTLLDQNLINQTKGVVTPLSTPFLTVVFGYVSSEDSQSNTIGQKIVGSEDLSSCDSITDISQKSICEQNVMANFTQAIECTSIPYGYTTMYKDQSLGDETYCLANIAIKTKDYSVCEAAASTTPDVGGEDARLGCYISVLNTAPTSSSDPYPVLTNQNICDRMSALNASSTVDDSRQVDVCYMDHARYTKNTRDCSPIIDPDLKYWCQLNFGTHADPELNPSYYHLSSSTLQSLMSPPDPYAQYTSIINDINHAPVDSLGNSTYPLSGYATSNIMALINYPKGYTPEEASVLSFVTPFASTSKTSLILGFTYVSACYDASGPNKAHLQLNWCDEITTPFKEGELVQISGMEKDNFIVVNQLFIIATTTPGQ